MLCSNSQSSYIFLFSFFTPTDFVRVLLNFNMLYHTFDLLPFIFISDYLYMQFEKLSLKSFFRLLLSLANY